ncbi:MAG: hypothetical protein FJ276_12180 [Planctomycetes bacterium]|nr:hypothetical protein [Planctomycetota bacterium]
MELPESVDVKVAEADRQWTIVAEVGGFSRELRVRVLDDTLDAFKVITPADKDEADTVWKFDMMGKLGVSQHNMCSCSVTVLGDLLFVNTSNGVDETEEKVAAPDAPSFLALDKHTGEVVWTDNSPGPNILHGQWSSPAAAVLGGVPQVIFAAGDGWVFSFRAERGQGGKPELLWQFDTNPKESKWVVGGTGDRKDVIATPTIYDGLVYVAGGHDPEFGEGDTSLWCIDPTKRGDVSPQLAVKADDHAVMLPRRRAQAVIPTQGEEAIDNPNSAVIWEYRGHDRNGDGEFDFDEKMHCTTGAAVIKNDLLFIADFAGLLHCLDAKTAQVHWTYDTMAHVWGTVTIADNRVYVGDEDGDVCVFELKAEPHEPISEQTMEDSLYTSPTVANGVLYIASNRRVFAIQASAD